jgi:hypothetical protein
MNEVVPWSTRTRDGLTATSRRVGRAVRSAWERFTDLGIGAVLLSLGVIVAVGIGVAVVQGRSGPTPSACDAAQPYLNTIQRLHHRGALTAADVTTLDDASARLADIARTAPGSAKSALTHASQAAANAEAGQPLDTGTVVAQYQQACDFSGGGGGGRGPGGSGF